MEVTFGCWETKHDYPAKVSGVLLIGGKVVYVGRLFIEGHSVPTWWDEKGSNDNFRFDLKRKVSDNELSKLSKEIDNALCFIGL